MPPAPSPPIRVGEPSGSQVRVFVADAHAPGADPNRLAQSLAWMTALERARAARFRHDRDREMFTLGRFMARTLVGGSLGIAPGDWTWREGPHGRPEIDRPATDLRFNLSHSGGLVVCVLARGRQVGVDVEHCARQATDWSLVERVCAPSEVRDIRAHGDRWRDRFLTHWTLKESYLKARGLGLTVHLADIVFTLQDDDARIGFAGSLAGTDDRWAFHRWQPGDGFLAAVAVEARHGRPPMFSVSRF